MGGPVVPDNPPAVQGQHDGQVLEADIVKHLVVSPLQEGGVNGDNRFEPFRGKPRGKGHPVLLGNAHIEKAVGKLAGKILEPGALAHGRRYGDDLFVLTPQLHHGAAENLRVGRRRARVRNALPGLQAERAYPVEFRRLPFGKLVALAFPREDVYQDGPVERLDVGQGPDKGLQFMPLERPDVLEAQFLKEAPRDNERLHGLLELLGEFEYLLAY